MSATIEQRRVTSRDPQTAPPFLWRWLSRLPLLIGLTSLLAWFLPTLIAVTPLRNLIVNAASTRLPDGIEVGSASLSWTGPIELRDVTVPDESGGNLLEVERIETEHSLWELATDGFTRALFRVFRPKLRLTMKENSTKIDSSVLQVLDRHVGRGKPFALDLENGLIVFVDEQGELLTEITDVVLTLDMTPHGDSSEGTLELTGRIARADKDGTLQLTAEWSGGAAEGRTGHIVLDVTHFPVNALGPMLASRLDDRRLEGEITATIEADWRPEAGLLAGDVQLDADEFAIELIPNASGHSSGRLSVDDAATESERWEFNDSMIRATGRYDPAEDQAVLSELVIDSEVVSLTAAGEVAGVQTQPVVDLQGELTSDPEILIAFLDKALPEALQIEDLTFREFSASGPLSELASLFQDQSDSESGEPPDAAADPLDLRANVSWSAMDFYGIQSPNGHVDAQLANSALNLTPLDVIVSGGRVESLPQLDLSASPRAFVLPAGPLVRNVAFTEPMCRTWMKYVSPLLADATGVDGRFSIDSRGGRIPVQDPHASEVAGTIQVQAGRIGPGPLARQIIAIVEQVRALSEGRIAAVLGGGRARQRTWLSLPVQEVNVRIEQGRVHHDAMRYVASDVTVVTRGSVGFDDSLDVVLEIPLPDEWLEGNRYLAALQGQTLEIPLRGTLEQPQVDARVINQVMEQMATGAGAGLLQQLFDR